MALDILFVDNLAIEIRTSFERSVLQLWPAGVLMFFLASGPLQLAAPEKASTKNKTPKKAAKPSPAPRKHAAETR